MKKFKNSLIAGIVIGVIGVSGLFYEPAFAHDLDPEEISEVFTGVESPLTRVAGFDWTIFDSPGELEGAVSQTKNTAVPIDVSGLTGDKKLKRDYYMVFGGVDKNDKKASFEAGTAGTTGKLLSQTGVNFPSVVGGKGPTDVMVGYGFDYINEYPGGGNLGSGFDLALPFVANGKVAWATGDPASSTVTPSRITPSVKIGTIEKLMTNNAKHEIYAYGYLKLYDSTEALRLKVPVRISGKPVNNKGRIRFTMKYYNTESVNRLFGSTYGVHMDIQGKHTESMMYSLGNNEGLYFKQETNKVATRLLDGENYYLYFYRGNYGDNSTNPPVSFIGNDDAYAMISNYFRRDWRVMYPIKETVDIAADTQYPYLNHPGWLYLYPQAILRPNEIGSSDLEISVTEQKARAVMYKYVDDAGKTLESVTDTLFTGDTYNPLDFKKEFTGYKFDRVDDPGKGLVGNTPITITFHYKTARTATINYLDDKNQVIETKKETLYVGDTYNVETYKKEITGYTFV
ncbi:hypothetical protein UAW_02713, partial [Enterococcus haemoperoxidus ATCC BAA-382]